MTPSEMYSKDHVPYKIALKGMRELTGHTMKGCMLLYMEYRNKKTIRADESIEIVDYVRLLKWLQTRDVR